MTSAEFLEEYRDSIAFQRRMCADMVCTDKNGKQSTDHVCTDRRTGKRMNRGEMYDMHAMTLCLMYELETGIRP